MEHKPPHVRAPDSESFAAPDVIRINATLVGQKVELSILRRPMPCARCHQETLSFVSSSCLCRWCWAVEFSRRESENSSRFITGKVEGAHE